MQVAPKPLQLFHLRVRQRGPLWGAALVGAWLHFASAASADEPLPKGLQPVDICLETWPEPPAGPPVPVKRRPHPVGGLAPLDLGRSAELPMNGYYIDMAGKVYRYRTIRPLVLDSILDAETNSMHLATEFYTGGFTPVSSPGTYFNGVYIPGISQFVPTDQVAYKAAAQRARELNEEEREARRGFGLKDRWQAALCAYNTHARYRAKEVVPSESLDLEE